LQNSRLFELFNLNDEDSCSVPFQPRDKRLFASVFHAPEADKVISTCSPVQERISTVVILAISPRFKTRGISSRGKKRVAFLPQFLTEAYPIVTTLVLMGAEA